LINILIHMAMSAYYQAGPRHLPAPPAMYQWTSKAYSPSYVQSPLYQGDAERMRWLAPDPPSWKYERRPEPQRRATAALGASKPAKPSATSLEGKKSTNPHFHSMKKSQPRNRQLPSPPPTPDIGRLDTPDLEPLPECDRFCECRRCLQEQQDFRTSDKGRVKMESQRMCPIFPWSWSIC
jgi:hypothetical protein